MVWYYSVITVWWGNQQASAPTWCHPSQATESRHLWVPLPVPFTVLNVILSLCPLKGLTSAQTDILCLGREGEIEGEEKVTWVTIGCLEMSSWRWKLFVLMDNVSFPAPFSSPLLYPSVRAINKGFSSPSVLRSFMSTWLLLKAAPRRRNTHYETKVRKLPDQSHRDGFRFTAWPTGWLINQMNVFKDFSPVSFSPRPPLTLTRYRSCEDCYKALRPQTE